MAGAPRAAVRRAIEIDLTAVRDRTDRADRARSDERGRVHGRSFGPALRVAVSRSRLICPLGERITQPGCRCTGLHGKLPIVPACVNPQARQTGWGRPPAKSTSRNVQIPRVATYPEWRLRQTRPESTDMPNSQWHKLYSSQVAAPPGVLFELLADMPNYGRWLRGSQQFGRTTDVEPYPVQLGSRYHDGKPDEPGKDWWGTVTGFQPPGSLDFHHTIAVTQLRATVDVHIHYSFEPENASTRVSRWLVLDISMPAIFRPLRRLIISSFDKENLRTMAAVKEYAEAHAGDAHND